MNIEKELKYNFKNKELLIEALTHPSYRYENSTNSDNQRLEFLGDAILGAVTAEYLFQKHPNYDEGILTKMRGALTNENSLAQIAFKINLGEYIRLGAGERLSGGNKRNSTLADCLEAIIAAIYLDSGFESIKIFFNDHFTIYLTQIESIINLTETNPKGELQEWAQANFKINPIYKTISEDGPHHERIYTINVFIKDELYGSGKGSSKQQAQIAAAKEAMKNIKNKS